MKKSKPLRARNLDEKKLEAATGGRGTCHGYYQCNYCATISATIFTNCSSCGRPYDGPSGGGGRGRGGK